MGNITYLHVGMGGKYYEGFINSDKETIRKGKKYKLDEVLALEKPWAHKDDSVDGIVGMGVFQQLHWRDLVFALRESLRVLKVGGVLRMGVPLIENGRPLDHLLGWNNTNLFNYGLLENVLLNHIGYRECRLKNYHETAIPEFAQIDNRVDHMFYIEAVK